MTIQIGAFKQDFVLVLTNAPTRYDYSYCIPVMGRPEDPERYVLIPENSFNEQTARYSSGLFQSSLAVDITDAAISDLLLRRMAGLEI